jgi:hypothetical protein
MAAPLFIVDPRPITTSGSSNTGDFVRFVVFKKAVLRLTPSPHQLRRHFEYMLPSLFGLDGP